MTRLLIVFTFLCLFTTITFAQKQEVIAEKAIVSTYDGSIFIGKIVAEDEFSIQLVAITKDTININKGFIKRIKRSDKNIFITTNGKYHYTKGAFYSLQLGFGFTDVGNETSQFDFIVGHRFNQKVAAGLGIGSHNNFSAFRGIWTNTNFIPVYAYGRYYPFQRKVQPFVSSKLGWGFPNRNAFGDEHSGGPIFQPGIGLNFASRKNSRFVLTLSQVLQNTKGSSINFDQFGNPINANFSLWYNRAVLTFAIEWR